MLGIKKLRKIPSKEAGKEVWKKVDNLAKESVKIVSGEGFSDRQEGILRDKEFLSTVEKFTQENKKLMIICWDKGGLQGLRDKFIRWYPNEEKRKKIREAIEKKTLLIYLAPKRPKWHFSVIDGKYLYVQKKHTQEAPSSKKPWLYCENDFFGEPLRHNEIFDNWAEKCSLVSPDDIIIQGG